MSLTATIQSAVDAAFTAIGDLRADVFLIRQIADDYNTTTRTYDETEAIFEFDGVVETNRMSFAQDGQRASSVAELQSEVTRVYLRPNDDCVPVEGDKLRIDETFYRVASVAAVKPDGVTVLLWDCQVTI